MGQWYTVDVTEVAVREGCNFTQLLDAVKKSLQGRNIAEPCAATIRASKTLKELIRNIYGPYGEIYDDECYWDPDLVETWHASFHGSYGWEGVMSECFIAMAPYLAAGCSLYVYPDEGAWGLTVREDGSAVEVSALGGCGDAQYIVVNDKTGECLRDGWCNPITFETEYDAQTYICDNHLVGDYHVEEYE